MFFYKTVWFFAGYFMKSTSSLRFSGEKKKKKKKPEQEVL
jgi:hypothetical protein